MANLHMNTDTVWQQRYTLPQVVWAKAAPSRPERAVVLTDKHSDTLQAHALNVITGETRQISRREMGMPLMATAFAPDGEFVYYLEDHKGNEIGHLHRLPYVGGEAMDVTPDLPAYSVRGIGFSGDGRYLGLVAVTQEGFHLYRVALGADGASGARQLVYQDKLEFWQAELSADGGLLGIISTRRTRSRLYSVVVFDAQTGAEMGELWDGAGQSVDLTCFSPLPGDERVLGTSTKSGQKRPYLWHPRHNERIDLDFPDLEGDVLAWGWSPDGQKLLLCQSHWAQQQLYTYDLTSGELTRLAHPGGTYDMTVGPFGTVPQFLPNGNILAIWQSAADPMQLVALDGRSGARLRVIMGPDTVVAGRPWQSITFTAADGVAIQGWLAVPDGDGPFPTLLHMHGGPHVAVNETFAPNSQAWVDHGFAFCTINYRGSTGFGAAFQSQIWGDLGHWELEDMVAARSWLVQSGIARPDAILLHGASYGGYLTLWGLVRRPDLWAGGIAVVAIADWVVNYEDAADAMKGAFTMWHGGSLAEVRERYVRSSPITYAENLAAPLLIVQGYNDTRTSARQMELFVAKLQELGKAVDIAWFDAGHGGLGTQEAIVYQERWMQFAQTVLHL
ncbi:MAG: S9 family peptidase [Anaerolinea sp.]|nr:S9 family peptidase [Anaerolinea sp.]